jgi:hypothetical protein
MPTSLAVGVPVIWPVPVLNAAHDGLASTPKLSVSPSASVALGANA